MSETEKVTPKKRVRKERVPEADPGLWEDFVTTRNPETRDILIMHYQPLVHATARAIGKSVGWKFTQRELVSNGQIGLIKAVDTYDPTVGPFKKLASTLIWGSIIDQMRHSDWLPRKYRVEQRTLQEVGDQYGYSLSTKELAEKVGWTEEKVREVLVLTTRADFYYFNVGRNIRGLPTETQGLDILQAFTDAFEKLTQIQQVILALRYYGKIPLFDVGELLGVRNVSEEHGAAVEALFDAVVEVAQ